MTDWTDRYAALAEVLIPEAAEHLSAIQAEVPTRWIHVGLEKRPDLAESFHRAVTQASTAATPEQGLRALAHQSPEGFHALTHLTAAAYFLAPPVRRQIGYPGQEARPVKSDMDDYIEMLAEVAQYGPAYRAVPEDKEHR